jgi:hypothetical protein
MPRAAFLLLLLVVTACADRAPTSLTPSEPAGGGWPILRWTLAATPSRDTLARGERVTIDVALTNGMDSTRTFTMPGGCAFVLDVRRAGADSAAYSQACPRMILRFTLRPGERWAERFTIGNATPPEAGVVPLPPGEYAWFAELARNDERRTIGLVPRRLVLR